MHNFIENSREDMMEDHSGLSYTPSPPPVNQSLFSPSSPSPFQTSTSFITYSIEFPPGSMGLDIEPVYITDIEVGVKVKDIYIA